MEHFLLTDGNTAMNKTDKPHHPLGVGEEGQEKDEMTFVIPPGPCLSLIGGTEQKVCERLFQLCTVQPPAWGGGGKSL